MSRHRATAILKRAGYAEGGALDDDMTEMEMGQAILNHVAARGDAAMQRRVQGVDPDYGRNTSKTNEDDDDDVKNMSDTFGPEEVSRSERREQNHLLDKYGQSRGGRLDRPGRKPRKK